jgi:prolyl oligopeptidase
MPHSQNLTDDPHLWLEDVSGDAALAWVHARNAHTQQLLQAQPEYEPTRARLLEMFNSPERIPHISRRGAFFYNLWQDEAHPRGLWRRTTLAGYRQTQPDWETVLDLDALSAAEGENWVWGGAVGLPPEHARCLISLSRGGSDAAVVREFDTVAKTFVTGGFELPEAKSSVSWADVNTLYVGTDFGDGSLTTSGYPRLIKRWQRGTPLEAATTVFEGEAGDMAVQAWVDHTPGFERTLFVRSLDFYRRHTFLWRHNTLQALDMPPDASFSFWNHAGGAHDVLLMELRSALTCGDRLHAAGSLLAIHAIDYLAGKRSFHVLFEPTAARSLASYATTRHHVIVNVLEHVTSQLEEWRLTDTGFEHRHITAPTPGSLSVRSLHDATQLNDTLADHYLLSACDFLTPDHLSLARAGSNERELLKSQPARFDATGMHAEQLFATSADGTQVPYFVVWPAGASLAHPANGSTPTLLYGYGGFEVSLQPWYASSYGSAWLARGGVLVVANIRGGGEYGPRWHQAALKHHKQRSYDDFLAVAQDLIARKITSPPKLGIEGGSNGGLLVGAAFTQRSDLFGAVVCSVPLLDMRRYHQLLAGASWMAEYGNPDEPQDWEHIARYSPYHHVKSGVTYPEVLFTTSTLDDRVHPGHARKMAARMLEQGHRILYFENTEGGHGGAANNAQRAHVQALEMSYLWRRLGGLSGLAGDSPAATFTQTVLYTDTQGRARFKEQPIALTEGKPSAMLSPLMPSSGCQLRHSPVGFCSEFHCTTTPQWVFILSGQMEIGLQDGTQRVFSPGQHFYSTDTLPEGCEFDVTLHGHCSKQLGNEPLVTVFVRG